MPVTEYDDFVIQIDPAADGFHRVEVVRSPAGKRFGRLRALTASESGGSGASSDSETTRDAFRKATPSPSRDPKEIGGELFRALFAGDVRECFVQSFGTATARGRRLRIRLLLDVNDASLAALATLPWELMYHDTKRDFLVLSADITFVRELAIPIDGYEPRKIDGPVRVLFVMADPTGTLDLNAERDEIERSLAEFRSETRVNDGTRRREIDATFLVNATFQSFEANLARDDYHIIHFMGHGEFDAKHRGQLVFQDRAVSGEAVATVLKKEKMTRLVTLNACRTGELSAAVGADPFAGVATAIVMAGIPAVVAMQFPVSDKAAIAFGARLYAELEKGEPIEAAVDSGRLKMMALSPDDREWATPVLFVRDRSPFSGDDFSAAAVTVEIVAPTRPAQRSTPSSANIAIDPWGPRTDDSFRVFVGETPETQKKLRGQIVKALKALPGVHVEDVMPPPDDVDDPAATLTMHWHAVHAFVRHADLCIHLLGATSGQPYSDDDDSLKTFPVEQLRIATERARPVLLCMPAGARKGIEEISYRDYVDQLNAELGKNAARFRLKEVEKQLLADEVVFDVVERQAALKTARAPQQPPPTLFNAYVDVLKHDLDSAEKLMRVLNRHDEIGRVTQVKSDMTRTPTQALEDFGRVLSEYQLYVVVQGNADADWARYRWEKASQAAGNQEVLVAVFRPTPAQGVEKFDIKLNRLPETFARAKTALKIQIEGLE